MTRSRAGVLFGVAAYGWWGLAPFYFKAVERAAPMEVLAHRVLWSLALLLVLLRLSGRVAALRRILGDRRALLPLLASALLVSVNWLTFIWSISAGRLLDASFGYYANPVLNVLLGFLLLGERLSRPQVFSVVLAALGATMLGLGLDHVPWVALILALSFGGYGLLRKRLAVDSVTGLAVETLLLAPLALAYLLFLAGRGSLAFLHEDRVLDLLLLAAGPMTALPLIWFVAAAQRLRFVTVGFLQYLAPSGQFLVAVLAFGEPFTRAHAFSFALIWTALAIYSLDMLRRRPRGVATRTAPPSGGAVMR